ncbi:MAG: toll/interleukin-1 receptor domain-containing protein [Chloroflexi bacterium]|nr:toll/interleukin-1 receptor domain-containing protein [Chloroflexota bacterium]
MAFKLGKFKNLVSISGKVNSLAYKDILGTKVLFWISDANCKNKPHKHLSNLSFFHVAGYAIRQYPTQIHFHVESSHKSIGFAKNDGNPIWSDFERIMPIEPAYYEEKDNSELSAYNKSSLIALPVAVGREIETFQILCEVSLDLPTSTSKPDFMELSISLQAPTMNLRNNKQPNNKKNAKGRKVNTSKASVNWDLFISHASEDKNPFVRSLVESLEKEGFKVWYDELSMTLGDSLRQSIEKGLANSNYGIVVLSENYFKVAKRWPQAELDGLFALETGGRKRILPIWHNIDHEKISAYSPIIAGRLGIMSSKSMDVIINEIKRAISVSHP